MSLPFKESIRRKMRSIAKLYELFVMKNYMSVQADVLQNLARYFGYSEIRNINNFLTSPEGQFCMKAYRQVLIDKYGQDPNKPNNPNTDSDPGFVGVDRNARDELVKKIINIIITKYNAEKGTI